MKKKRVCYIIICLTLSWTFLLLQEALYVLTDGVQKWTYFCEKTLLLFYKKHICQLPNIHFSNSESLIGYREFLFFKWLYNHYNSITPRSLTLSYLICPDPQPKFLLVLLLNFKQKINGSKTTDSTELIVFVFVFLISGDHF